MRHLAADRFQFQLRRRRIEAAQVVVLDLIMGRVRENLLQPVVANDRPQHVVTIDQLLPGGLQPVPVDARQAELHVAVTAGIA